MSAGAVLFEQRGNIAILTMNRIENRNANSTPEMVDALCEAIDRINLDPEIHVAILTGAGTTYSSGGEAKLMSEFSTWNPVEVRQYYIHHGIQKLTRAMYRLEVPVIAAVNGPAYGSGTGSALMCDIRIASSKARFALNFSKLGLLPGDGGIYFLTRIVGPERAAEMIFTGDSIDAEDALKCGLVSRVVAPEKLMEEAVALAQRIAANPGTALRMAKRLLREAHQAGFDSFLDLTVSLQAMGHNTEEHRVALGKFLHG
ncbi:MAG: enoyl-CoA hydratase-related protein, partial [Thermomicrobiales bacterium]